MHHTVPALQNSAGALDVPAADGVVLRRLKLADEAAFVAHLRRLEPNARRFRFAAPVNDDFIAGYAARALSGTAHLRGLFVDGILRGVAELHPLADGATAEGAFSLEAAYRGRGLGTRLFGSLLDAARNRDIARLVLNCLRENVPMQRIARRFGGELAFEQGEVVAEILRPRADVGTLAREWGDEIRALLSAARPAGEATSEPVPA